MYWRSICVWKSHCLILGCMNAKTPYLGLRPRYFVTVSPSFKIFLYNLPVSVYSSVARPSSPAANCDLQNHDCWVHLPDTTSAAAAAAAADSFLRYRRRRPTECLKSPKCRNAIKTARRRGNMRGANAPLDAAYKHYYLAVRYGKQVLGALMAPAASPPPPASLPIHARFPGARPRQMYSLKTLRKLLNRKGLALRRRWRRYKPRFDVGSVPFGRSCVPSATAACCPSDVITLR